MANYVEYIKVGSGESWAVRDAEAQESISTLNTTVGNLDSNMDKLNTAMAELQSDVEASATDVQMAKELSENALPKTGGAMTGALILTENEHWGTTLPEPGTVGRIFFKVVE